MSARPFSTMGLAGTLLGMAALLLLAIGAPAERSRAPAPPPPSAPPVPSVSGGGFTLASVSVDLPAEDPLYPDGPGADTINADCTSCHSASMALTQPPLPRKTWEAIVAKMRTVYHAPVPEGDVPAIVDYLSRLSGAADAAGTDGGT